MLAKMALAVVNGAITTIGAAGLMCLTYITFFQKFGIVILATVFYSLIVSLFFFSALMVLIGPEGTCGDISLWCGTKCFDRCKATGTFLPTMHTVTPGHASASS